LDEGVEGALTALCERHGIGDAQRTQLKAILAVLAGDRLAPTTIRDPRQAVKIHLADSLAALELEVVRGAGRVADLGAGAGFPGLALAAALPRSEVYLVEGQARKCAFMERVCAVAGIGNARVIRARAEEWGEGLRNNDVVVARALAPQPVVLEYAAPLLRLGGTLVDWRGRRDVAEEQLAAAAAGELGLRLSEICRVEPFVGARDHHLHVCLKVAETPPRFPRRAGIARKRPLGGKALSALRRDRR
jgi:16S rRNA (guanine527-N7)-methyltransferase